jgi:hypothetical protein
MAAKQHSLFFILKSMKRFIIQNSDFDVPARPEMFEINRKVKAAQLFSSDVISPNNM